MLTWKMELFYLCVLSVSHSLFILVSARGDRGMAVTSWEPNSRPGAD